MVLTLYFLRDDILKDKSTNAGFIKKFIGVLPQKKGYKKSNYLTWDYTEDLSYKHKTNGDDIANPILRFPEKNAGSWYKGNAQQRWITVLFDKDNYENIMNNINSNFSFTEEQQIEIAMKLIKEIEKSENPSIAEFYRKYYGAVAGNPSSKPPMDRLFASLLYITFMICISNNTIEGENFINLFTTLKDQYKLDQENNEDKLSFKKLRCFIYEGVGETAFRYEVSHDGMQVLADIDFDPNEYNDTSPKFGGLYLNFPSAKDVSDAQKIMFDICSPDEGIRSVRFEIKPCGSKWMHETFVIQLTKETKSVEIEICEFENNQTAKELGEFTWALYGVDFKKSKNRKGKLKLGNFVIR